MVFIPACVFINMTDTESVTLQSWRMIFFYGIAHEEVQFYLMEQRTREVQATVSLIMFYCIKTTLSGFFKRNKWSMLAIYDTTKSAI